MATLVFRPTTSTSQRLDAASCSDDDEVLSVGSVSPPPANLQSVEEDACSSTYTSSRSSSSADHQDLQLSSSALKFSIDNILKPEFGRHISPIYKFPAKSGGSGSGNGSAKRKETAVVPIDLTAKQATTGAATTTGTDSNQLLWPAWVYCTRYSDRPSSGPRSRRVKRTSKGGGGDKGGDKSVGSGGGSGGGGGGGGGDEKRPRTAFSGEQLARLKLEFAESRYLTERRRQQLAAELRLHEAQIKIWFQNKRAKIKKASGHKNPLALQLMAQGLYNHSTIPLTREEEEQAAQAEQNSRD